MDLGVSNIQMTNAILEIIANTTIKLRDIDIINTLKIDKPPHLNNRMAYSEQIAYDVEIILNKLIKDGYIG